MAWTQPRTWANEIVNASDLATELRSNQVALKAPPFQTYEANEVSNYGTISSTYADVDSTNYSFTITTTGGDVLIGFNGGAKDVYLDVSVDGTLVINNTDGGLVDATAYGSGCCFMHIITGLSAGSHTFVLQFKTAVFSGLVLAGAGTASLDIHSQFFCREIS